MSEIHTHDQELKRDPAIELARWIGCLIVIGCHTYLPIISGDNYDAGRLFFGLIFADGVAIFWLIGGAFLFNNTEYSKLLLRSVEKILLPLFRICCRRESVVFQHNNKAQSRFPKPLDVEKWFPVIRTFLVCIYLYASYGRFPRFKRRSNICRTGPSQKICDNMRNDRLSYNK